MGVYTIRFKFFKKDELKYLSHLDVLALMERALMRTGMPLLYSGGFHPKPKLSFSNPIPLGVQSIAEYCDIELLEEISAGDFTGLLNRKLPDKLKVTDAINFEKTSENKVPSLMSAIDIVLYEYGLLLGKISSVSFLKDFERFFNPAEKNVGCKADLLKITGSILNYEAAAIQTAASLEAFTGQQENIFFLKIFGYAKILKNSSNTIFKFNAFNEYFEKFLETADIEIKQVQKTGTYIFKDNVLTDPIEIISFYAS